MKLESKCTNLMARSYCGVNDIIFITLVLSNIDVTNGYRGAKWRCPNGNGILNPKLAVATSVNMA